MTVSLTCVAAAGSTRRAPLLSYLSPALRESTRQEANDWIKRLRLVPYGEETMRSRFRYRDDSLWWFTELYLHKMRRIERGVSSLFALEAAVAAESPVSLRLDEVDAVTRAAADAFSRVHRIPITIGSTRPEPDGKAWTADLVRLTAVLSRLRPRVRASSTRRPRVAAFVHTAFWTGSAPDPDDPQQERYIGPVLDALARRVEAGELSLVGVGPRRNFRARRWWDPFAGGPGTHSPVRPIEALASRAALAGAFDLWRRRRTLASAIVEGNGIRGAAVWRGYDLWPILQPELEEVALVQWPWSVRAMDEAGAALDRLAPRAALTYAEAGGWGRALVLEARRRGIPSVGIQHGFIYRHWLNYRHEPDEIAAEARDAGCPLPDRTLLFDESAAEDLRIRGHFPSSRLAVTGSARLDELSAAVAACRQRGVSTIRQELQLPHDARVLVLVAKHSEIRADLDGLLEATALRPDLHLAIKPHPAETPAVYAAATTGQVRVTILGAEVDLARALAAADGLVTANSTVAIDGLSLGIPALVIGLPTNLSPFVDAGVMLGATDAAAIGPELERLLYDQDARARLVASAGAFADRHAMRPTGRAAERAADEVLALAR